MTDDIIDLDKIIAEREPKKVRIRGKIFDANPDPSFGVIRDLMRSTDDAELQAANIDAFFVEVFGKEHAEEIVYMIGPSSIEDLAERLVKAYDVGKEPGSNRASRRAGTSSTRTSAANTKSTSTKRASEQNGSIAATSHA